jgi:hypothetical protein
MQFKKFPIFFLILFTLMLSSTALAACVPFAVTQPDGTDDSTSGYYTIQWTPAFGCDGIDANMIKGINTISCYATGSSTVPSTVHALVTKTPCCDTNQLQVYVGSLPGRGSGSYYVWCTNDKNSDMNDFSSGAFSLVRYGVSDFGKIAVDVPGGILSAIARNMGAIAVLFIISIIVIILLDLLTGVIGIIAFIKGTFGGSRG